MINGPFSGRMFRYKIYSVSATVKLLSSEIYGVWNHEKSNGTVDENEFETSRWTSPIILDGISASGEHEAMQL